MSFNEGMWKRLVRNTYTQELYSTNRRVAKAYRNTVVKWKDGKFSVGKKRVLHIARSNESAEDAKVQLFQLVHKALQETGMPENNAMNRAAEFISESYPGKNVGSILTIRAQQFNEIANKALELIYQRQQAETFRGDREPSDSSFDHLFDGYPENDLPEGRIETGQQLEICEADGGGNTIGGYGNHQKNPSVASEQSESDIVIYDSVIETKDGAAKHEKNSAVKSNKKGARAGGQVKNFNDLGSLVIKGPHRPGVSVVSSSDHFLSDQLDFLDKKFGSSENQKAILESNIESYDFGGCPTAKLDSEHNNLPIYETSSAVGQISKEKAVVVEKGMGLEVGDVMVSKKAVVVEGARGLKPGDMVALEPKLIRRFEKRSEIKDKSE